MSRIRAIAFAAVVLSTTGTARPADVTLPDVVQVLGSVTSAAKPVASALVIALNLGNLDAIQTFSNVDGNFALPPLRSGIYKVIAVKYGYTPAMTVIVPTKPKQHLAMRMGSEKSARAKDATTAIWEIRGSLPADVLRELDAVMAPPQSLRQIDVPRFTMEHQFTLAELELYFRSWSGVQRYIDATGDDPVPVVIEEIAGVWGERQSDRTARFELFLRAGRVSPN